MKRPGSRLPVSHHGGILVKIRETENEVILHVILRTDLIIAGAPFGTYGEAQSDIGRGDGHGKRTHK